MNKIKVVWICSFSNSDIRKNYTLNVPFCVQILHRIVRGVKYKDDDRAQWNTNAIKEFEKIKEVELHIISPVYFLSKSEVRFERNGIHYYFIKDENSSFLKQLTFRFYRQYHSEFLQNRRNISRVISELKPDIVHVIGAENPFYSMSILDIPKSVISIIQLQTLLNEAIYNKTLSVSKILNRKAEVESLILNHAGYIGTSVTSFKTYISDYIKANCKFLNLQLALSEPIHKESFVKKYDFVYFSLDISKAFDQALEAFALAVKQDSNLTINVVGGYSLGYKKTIDKRIADLGISASINFEGKQATHEDVLSKIRQCRYALLPLSGDKVSGTIREAMANGLPVVSIITDRGTPLLNLKRKSILLSERYDYEDMAKNMLNLAHNTQYAEMIRTNAYITVSEIKSNKIIIEEWFQVYKTLLNKCKV